MKYLRSWLQDYIVEPLPATEELVQRVNTQAFELEGVEMLSSGDTIFDFDVKPNRAHDAWALIGMAKEVATLFDLTFKAPEGTYATDASLRSADMIAVMTDDPKFSPRVMKRIVADVVVDPSPEWLRTKLESVGQRSINNIVDITNFVMLETGQPVHAFDYDKLAGKGTKNVRLRRATKGERIETLDGKTYDLTPDTFVWADDEHALDVAGIKGGTASGIDEKTKRIMLSICNFNPSAIRKTSRTLGLITDASKRFEQGLTPELPARAMDRACSLISDLAHGRISEDIIDLYPRRRAPYRLGASLREVNNVLGSTMTNNDMEDILRRLGFAYNKVTPAEEVLRLAPTFVDIPYKYGASVSFDCPRVFDCGSFVNYLFAQNGIALPRMVQDQFLFGEEVSETDVQPGDLVFSSTDSDGKTEHIESLNIDQVRQTKQTIEFLPGKKLSLSVDHAGIYLGDGKIIHASPMSDKGKVLVEELKDALKFQKIVGFRRIPDASEERYVVTAPSERLDLHAGGEFMISGTTADLIEEIGRVYGYDNLVAQPLVKKTESEINKIFYYSNKIRDVLVGLGFSEVYTYSLTEKGEVELANPLASDKGFLRGSLSEGLLKAFESNSRRAPLLGSKETLLFEIGTVFTKDREFIELGIMGINEKAESAAKILEETLGGALQKGHGRSQGLGYFLNLADYIAELSAPVSYADLAILDPQRKTFTTISNYPFVLRDIAVWVPQEVESEKVIKFIKGEAGNLLIRADQFDSFSKDGKTSYAYHLVFQSQEKTLSDDEVNAIMERVTTQLNNKEGFKVR